MKCARHVIFRKYFLVEFSFFTKPYFDPGAILVTQEDTLYSFLLQPPPRLLSLTEFLTEAVHLPTMPSHHR